MSRSIVIASPEENTDKQAVSLGFLALLSSTDKRVDFFRPLVSHPDDAMTATLAGQLGTATAKHTGVTFEEIEADREKALAKIVQTHLEISRNADLVIVDGTGQEDVAGGDEFALNAEIAANIAAPMVIVLSALDSSLSQIRRTATKAISHVRAAHAQTIMVVVTRCLPTAQANPAAVREALQDIGVPVLALPEDSVLHAPTFRQVVEELGTELLLGSENQLDREIESVLVCGMNAEHVLERLAENQGVIAAGDRSELLTTLVAAHAAEGFPALTGILLIGFRPPEQVLKLVRGLGQSLPVAYADLDSFQATQVMNSLRGEVASGSPRKVEHAISLVSRQITAGSLEALLEGAPIETITPLRFQAELISQARTSPRTIVLPESDDDRILEAAHILLASNVAKLVLLGDEATINARATTLGLDLAKAKIVSPNDPELVERYATEFARVRAAKGVTLEQARQTVQDVSYFGTMMVHMGDAEGMVSGAAHTTAHTIVPSFQVIKTKPETSVVSSVFLMLMSDRVLVYGDCAINPDPTAEQLAGIAISSAATAKQFGVEPRVAMISYSTGDSGSGSDVDKVREAVRIARERAPELAIDGPIQYDASVDATVAAKKLPGSEVAGRATVFIFPDLNTGNTTYKAVQRSAHAVAVGPILQGLNKPVNDLSRGALVEDIVNTVAITVVQAQAASATSVA